MGPEQGLTQPTPGFLGFRGPGILHWVGLGNGGFWENCGGFWENGVDLGEYVADFRKKNRWIKENVVDLGNT